MDEPRSVTRSLWRAAFLGLLVVFAATHVFALFTENVNWDEFALLQRSETAARTGVVSGGGRPGLATVLLVPLARECVNAVDTLRAVRGLWLIPTFAAAWAFWILLGAVVPKGRHAWAGRATGLGLWVLAPPFLRYSLQVRTDQPAIALGLWGGVALLASRRRPEWAAAAGFLMGTGFLFTQKLVYVAGLAGIIVLADTLRESGFRLGLELRRGAFLLAGFAATLLAYRMLMSRGAGDAPVMMGVSSGLDVLAMYREWVGWYWYRGIASQLIPQFLGTALLLPVTVLALRDSGRDDRWAVAAAWTAAAAGATVLLFHAGRFPYFIMTVGLFPATVGAIVTGVVLTRTEDRGLQTGLLAVVWIPLMTLALGQSASLMEDTQGLQRESLAFVERNFDQDARGFGALGAFVCRHDLDPFPVRFSQHVIAEFAGEDGEARGAQLVEEFRNRPVAFFIPPFPGEPYPEATRAFWRTRYVPYHAHVWLPGTVVSGADEATFEAVLAGRYVWLPEADGTGALTVAGMTLQPGRSVELDAGTHELLPPTGVRGRLVLEVPESGSPAEGMFYKAF